MRAKKQDNRLRFRFITLLGILLFFPPFFGGLFDNQEWLYYQTAIGTAALLFIILKLNNIDKATPAPLDLATAALCISYVLSIFVAVNFLGAVEEAFKTIAYFLIFYLISRSVTSIIDILTILKSFYFSGVVVLLISIGTAFGTFHYTGALADGRLHSTLEYANAFAAYTISLFFIGFYLAGKERNYFYQLTYNLTNFLLLIGFFGAKSRGGLLVFMVVLLIYFFGLPAKSRFSILTQTAFSGVPAYLFINYVFPPLVDHNRLTQISLSASEAQHRLAYYHDALKIAGDYPILGTGGLGWKAVYPQYQEFSYTTADVHNHYLQVLVESGMLGLIALIGIWVVFILMAVNLNRKISNQEDKLLFWSIFCAALTIGMHSLLDIDLSIPAVSILLWGLFGCLRGWQRLTGSAGPAWRLPLMLKGLPAKLVPVVLALFFLSMSIILLVSSNLGEQGLGKLSKGYYATAQDDLSKAVWINPIAGNYLAGLSKTLIFLEIDKQESGTLQSAAQYVDKAISLEPRNPEYRLIKGKILAMSGKVAQAVGEFEQAGKLRPYQQKYVDILAEAYLNAGKYYYLQGDKDKARIYLAKAKLYPEVVAERINKIEPRYKEIQSRKVQLVISEKVSGARQTAITLLAGLTDN